MNTKTIADIVHEKKLQQKPDATTLLEKEVICMCTTALLSAVPADITKTKSYTVKGHWVDEDTSEEWIEIYDDQRVRILVMLNCFLIHSPELLAK